MTISQYRVLKDYHAPKINLRKNEFQSYKIYKAGSIISGYIDLSTGRKLLVVDSAYVIPSSAIAFVKDIEIDGKPVTENTENANPIDAKLSAEEKIKLEAAKKVKSNRVIEIPKEYREQMDKIKNTNIVGSIVSKSRNSVNGMLIGAGIGLLLAVVLKQSKFGGIIIGATGGGLIGYKMTGAEKKKKTTPEEPKTETKKP
jgi:hypothetical protein